MKYLTENNYIAINTLQHYIFCPHQWGLMEIENQWRENIFVVLGNIVHEKVDNPFMLENRGSLHISRSVPIYSHKYKIQGVCDVVEFVRDEKGVFIPQLNGNYSISVVEYKRGRPKIAGVINYADSIQVTAQMLCINEMFGTQCKGYVYYASIGRRCPLSNLNEKVHKLTQTLEEMQQYIKKSEVPKIQKMEHCASCSFVDVCLPKIKSKSFADLIKTSWEDVNEKTA